VTPLEVVLTPPQREQLRRVLDLPDLSDVELTGEGWHRFAVLAPGQVLLLPRSHRWVPGLRREVAALEFLGARGVAVPRLLASISDDRLWPYPATLISRYDARPWSALQESAGLARVTEMLVQLGRLVASYHRIDVAELPEPIATPAGARPDAFEAELPHFSDFLESERLEKLCFALAAAAELPGNRVDVWLRFVQPLLDLEHVLVHRDINEGQVMIDSAGEVCGLIDWEGAGVQHPLSDFDFGEWGFPIFAHEPEFAQLRKAFWESYVAARGVDLPDWQPVHLLMTIINAPGPEGAATAWYASRRDRTLTNLRAMDAQL
jgi:aminoglycoside phosphotransferase (APT) family kinase protein